MFLQFDLAQIFFSNLSLNLFSTMALFSLYIFLAIYPFCSFSYFNRFSLFLWFLSQWASESFVFKNFEAFVKKVFKISLWYYQWWNCFLQIFYHLVISITADFLVGNRVDELFRHNSFSSCLAALVQFSNFWNEIAPNVHLQKIQMIFKLTKHVDQVIGTL